MRQVGGMLVWLTLWAVVGNCVLAHLEQSEHAQLGQSQTGRLSNGDSNAVAIFRKTRQAPPGRSSLTNAFRAPSTSRGRSKRSCGWWGRASCERRENAEAAAAAAKAAAKAAANQHEERLKEMRQQGKDTMRLTKYEICAATCAGEWTMWTKCSKPCGGGTKNRTRVIQLSSMCEKLKNDPESGFNCTVPLQQKVWCNVGCQHGGTPNAAGCSCRPGWEAPCCLTVPLDCDYQASTSQSSTLSTSTIIAVAVGLLIGTMVLAILIFLVIFWHKNGALPTSFREAGLFATNKEVQSSPFHISYKKLAEEMEY